MVTDFKTSGKDSDLFDPLFAHFGKTMNLARIKFPQVARLIFKLLPHKGPCVLSMDRTNWQFGSFDINALVLAATKVSPSLCCSGSSQRRATPTSRSG